MDKVLDVDNVSKSYTLNRKKNETLRERINFFAKNPLKIYNTFLKQESSFWALKNINFSLNEGDALGVVGYNGAGKSTLLKIISRVTPPSNGKIKIKGKVTSLLEVGTGFHSELSGRENIFLNGAILGMTKKEIKKKLDQIVDFSGVEKFIDMPVKHYSSGMYVRLAFAVAAFMESDIMLIDEVLAVGDIQFQNKCLQKIEKLKLKSKQTIIFVSHNLQSVKSICNKCVLLKNGRIDYFGETEETVHRYLNDNDHAISNDLALRVDRKGSGQARVVKVYLKDKEGKDVKNFCSGEDAYIWIEYEVFDEIIKELDLSFPISDFGGVNKISHIYSRTVNQKIKVVDKRGVVVLKINKLPLNEGEYFYNVWLENNGLLLDWIVNAGSLIVKSGDFYGTGKMPLSSQGNYLLDYNFRIL